MNASEALVNVETMIKEAEEKKRFCRLTWRISGVCEQLGIFDWWVNELSVSQLKQMRSFLKASIKRGYTGYVCFKVGSVGCAHGMWAHKKESTNGYSPDGACLYHSFRCDENFWDAQNDDGVWLSDTHKVDGRYKFKLKEVDEFIVNER